MKITSSSASLCTRDIAKMMDKTGNLYKSVAVISRRANDIAAQTKEELSSKLLDFASTVDNLEEIHENREQIEISKYYERMPKPSNLATDEFLEGRVEFGEKDQDV